MLTLLVDFDIMATMETLVNINEAKTHFSQYVSRAMAGEKIVISRYGKPQLTLVPLSATPPVPRKLGGLKGKIIMKDNFDDPMMDLWETIANK